jgi:hypothetical protein
MKFRLTVFILLLSIGLSACSFAEDITPPPGYRSPTPAASLEPATQTPLPTRTLQPATATPEPAIVGTVVATPTVDGSMTPLAPVVTINGHVTNPSGTPLKDNLIATLYLYNTTTTNVDQSLTTQVNSDGSYQFTGVSTGTSITYFVTVDYGDVTYTSDPANYDATKTAYELPVTVYDAIDNWNVLTITQVHVSYDFSVSGKVQAQVLYVISNPGTQTVVVTSDGTSVPFIQIPAGATDVQYRLAQGSASLISAKNGFAMLPGANKQYGLLALYNLPYTKSLKVTQPFNLPVAALTVIVPEGVRVRSEQLQDGGVQAYQGTNYHLYQGNALASGSTLALTLSGMPGAPTGFTLNRQTWVMIGIAVIGLLLIGLGVFLYFHDRARYLKEDELAGGDETEKDALGNNSDSITDAIIALDDQYKAGEISKEAYEERRDELKDRLKKSLG